MVTVFALMLAVAAFAFVGYPLFKPRTEEKALNAAENEELEELLSKRYSTYSAIKELEFDREVGSLSPQDYEDLEKRYHGKAVSILKSIDEASKGKTVEEEAERQILELRQARKQGIASPKEMACSSCGHKYQAGAKFCAGCGAALPRLCPCCQTPYRQGDRFCSKCGQRLSKGGRGG